MTAVTGGPVASSNDLGVSDLERIDAIFTNPDLYTFTDGYPERDHTLGGRPQVYPDWFGIGFGCLTSTYKSARAAATALHGPMVWDHVRGLAKKMCPDEPAKWLPDKPPSRTWVYQAEEPDQAGGSRAPS